MRSLIVLVALLLLPCSALAHRVGISRGEYRADGSTLQAELTFARPEFVAAVPGLDGNGDGLLTADEVSTGRERLAGALLNGLEVRSARGRCAGDFEGAALTANDGLALRLSFHCPEAAEAFRLRLSLLQSLSVGHRHLAETPAGTQVVYEASPAFEVRTQAGAASGGIAGQLFAMGIVHILTGFDHLLFLLGVVLVAGKLRSVLFAVTAFTLAHSLTLALATLGVWAPSPSIVEPAIALSIVYVGVENWYISDLSRRWLLTFPFGLIHGFGFAGALREIAMPKAEVPLALVSFNLGVEAGQLLVLAVLLPILFWLRRREWFARQGVRATSPLIALTGFVWFVQRVS